MATQELIQRGNPGYSKQQKQLKDAANTQQPPTIMPQDTTVASTIGGKQYNAGGGLINPYNTPITSSSLAPKPAVNLPTPPVPKAGTSAQATVNAATANNAQQQAQIDQKNQQDQTGSDILDAFKKDVMGIQDEITSAQSSVDRTAQEAERLNANRLANEIEAEQNATRQRVEELRRTNPTGALAGALEDQIRDIERESLIKQTSKAVLLNAANRNFEALKEAADSALALKLEPLKLKLENTKLFYQENRDLFNKADERAYQEKIKEQDREYKKAEAIETQITDLKKNVAQYAGSAAQGILQQLSKIDTSKPDAVSKALAIAGQYQEDPLDRAIKQAQLNKLRQKGDGSGAPTIKSINGKDYQWNGKEWVTPSGVSGQTTALRSLDETNYSKFTSNPNYESINNGIKYTNALKDFKKAVSDYGTRDITAKGQGALNSSYATLVATTKDYYKLGTLDAGVEKLVSLGVPAPGKYRTRDKKVISSLNGLESSARTSINNAKDQLSKSPYADTQEFASLIAQIPNGDNKSSGAQNNQVLQVDSNGNIVIPVGEVSNEEFFK